MAIMGYKLESRYRRLGAGLFNARHRQHVIYTSVSSVVIGVMVRFVSMTIHTFWI